MIKTWKPYKNIGSSKSIPLSNFGILESVLLNKNPNRWCLSCSSLLLLIRKGKDINTDIPLVGQDSAMTPDVDVRQQAVEEMMHRIKRGIQLRPVSQSPNRGRKQRERLPSNSAIQELKGIMENFGRFIPQAKAMPPSAGGDELLQRILLRRRGALEP
ncbi:shootin-1-like [Notothenia coriiceps]|uniref:Shootin-1 n=1 Tax=Notothenia coriiceps TaxID=8208 RepID=A0A6I9P862_9TELE|nr:PREDICTED: shootin-1-like [Notothenia coriiceps]